jgi:glycerophosphoryl diester phosphodiesterase
MKKIIGFCLALVAVTGRIPAQTPSAPPKATELAPVRSSWNVRDHVPLSRFIIQSHRGAGELAPENTLEAFELGWQLGTYPEADVRTTKDGVIVAFHDNDFSRVVKGVGPERAKQGVTDVTFAELSRLDVGAWKGDRFAGRRISRMTEVFARMQSRPERHLYLDIKNVELKQLASEVKAAGVQNQVVLASSKHTIIQDWKALVPQSDTLLWMGGTEAAKSQQIAALRAAGFAGITQLQAHVRFPGDAQDVKPGEPFSPSRAFLVDLSRELAGRGILFQTLPYGATNAGTYWQLMDLGLASFATDHPEVTLRAVRDYYARPQP